MKILWVVAFLSWSNIAFAAEYPVRWTSEVKLKDSNEIDRLLDRRGNLSEAGEGMTLTLINDSDKEIDATNFNCKEYFNSTEKGFYPKTNYDVEMDGWFNQICSPLKYLKNVSPSRISYLENFKLSDAPLKTLPLTLGLYLSGDEEERVDTAFAKGMTWEDFSPEMKAEIKSPNLIELIGDDSLTVITLLAWGDFNGDGTEDILLNVSHSIPSGTYHDYNHVILTRLGENGKLVQMMKEGTRP